MDARQEEKHGEVRERQRRAEAGAGGTGGKGAVGGDKRGRTGEDAEERGRDTERPGEAQGETRSNTE